MARELIALFIAMCLFLEFMADYVILWWEALIMFVYYACIYVPVLGNFDQIKQVCARPTVVLIIVATTRRLSVGGKWARQHLTTGECAVSVRTWADDVARTHA